MRRAGWTAIVAAAMVLVPLAGWCAGDEPVTLEIGATAPDFSLPGVDGRTYSLKDFADSDILVVVFTCNHCPTAQAYEDRIMGLAADYKDKGVALVAISPNDPKALRLDELGYTDLSDSFDEMKVRAKDKGFNFPYLYDGDAQAVSRAYGPTTTPHVFILDKARTLRYVGRVDDSQKVDQVTTRDARNALDALLAGQPVPVEKTKTFGCSIKWLSKRDSVQQALEKWAQEAVAVERIDAEGVKALVTNDSGKLRLINVWATWCGPCVVEFPELVGINRMYRNRDFELITISADSPAEESSVLAFLKGQQASSRNYHFGSGNPYALSEALDKDWPGAIPYTMLVAPGGEVLFRQVGAINPLEVKKAIVGYLGRYYK